ncbi:MAG TPA: peptidoglycan DD-metalloendopeptidase family protein [Nevskiaceae bacterium]|nr:peptidoglycan DD-metalloendopeptidase family protein [Nevskiaceae bacterium]
MNRLDRAGWCAAALLACVVLSGCASLLSFGNGSQGPVYNAPRNGTVVVARGDTLYSIAFRNGLDYRQLAAWNDIGPSYTIYPGERLRLTPPSGSTAPRRTVRQPQARHARRVQRANPRPVVAPPPVALPARVTGWQWPAQGSVLHHFDLPRQQGIDIRGQYGSNVVAAAAGQVVYSGDALKGYGQLIIIKHSDDYLSAYGFNSRLLVSEGQQVTAGQLIAQMGEGPGQVAELHFEIRYKGQPVDPLKFLPSR